MSSNLIGLVIAALGTIITVAVAVGLPALAIVCVRYLKLKERELVLESEHRQEARQQELALAQRVERIEQALATLGPDMRERLATPLPSEADFQLEERTGAPQGR